MFIRCVTNKDKCTGLAGIHGLFLFLMNLHHLLNYDMYFLHVLTLFDFNRNSHSFFAKWALSGSSKLIPVELTTSAILLSNLSSENRYMKKSKP